MRAGIGEAGFGIRKAVLARTVSCHQSRITNFQSRTMTDTIFGKIIRREIPATIVYEDDEVLGFQDIAPQAPVHVLFIPKQHAIPTLDDVPPEQALLVGQLAIAAAAYARAQGLAQDGYRIVMNCREHAGQTVFHIHLHLLAGAPLGRFGTP